MKKPEVSIIIPCFNCSETLKEAFESCFEQNIEGEFEIVMVDDCSTDKTASLIRELSKGKENVKIYFHEKNRGGGATRNTATKISTSNIIFCLDSDDILPKGTVGKMHKMLKEKKCDGIGIHKSIKFKGKNKNNISHINEFGYVGQKIPFESLIENKDGPFCPLYSTFMFTKESFKITGGYPEDHGFDTQGFAWRFLLNDLVAYTCPEASYLHRINFHESYYVREYLSGKTNLNWIKIFTEFIPYLKREIVDEILNFNINSDNNILDIIKSYPKVFKEKKEIEKFEIVNLIKKKELNFEEYYWLLFQLIKIGRQREIKSVINNNPSYKTPSYVLIDNNNTFFISTKKINLLSRIVRKFKKKLRNNTYIYKSYSAFISLINNIKNLYKQKKERDDYYKEIKDIINNKEIILDISFGGLGDWLVFTTLPKLLKEKYNINFYLSEDSVARLRNNDTFKLCFEENPYFCGIKKSSKYFKIKIFSIEKKILNFLFDMKGENLINIIESQFDLKLSEKPEIFYQPKKMANYTNTILVDKNYISGKKLGWKYDDKHFEKEINKYKEEHSTIEYIDPTKQDLFTYADMIYSCKRFITTLSGGAALASCFNKDFSVILPHNVTGGSVDNFVFKKSKATYKK